ncbi:MAG: hypothetical protein WCI93_01995 [bacterium]
MDPESKKLLEKTYELVKENSEILHKVRSVQKWQAFWSTLRIIILIGVTLGAAYYLQPFLEKAINLFNQISSSQQVIDTSSLQNILKNMPR